MGALSELEALARRQTVPGKGTPDDVEQLADAATVFLCAGSYMQGWLERVYEDTGRIDLRDLLAALQEMRLDLLSIPYQGGTLQPDALPRLTAAQRTLLHAMTVLRDSYQQEYGRALDTSPNA
jgi:hypothetical protein